jgi:non-specific serine/threonine protein kinase
VIGETTSHYRVLESLGKGGMGEVYLAEDLRLHRRVALKMLRAEALGDDEAGARLLREARAASALNHPNIAVIYEIDEVERAEGKVRFIAMEYVAGQTLSEAAGGAAVSLDTLLDWAGQVADALGEAHSRGIVHRDVKPSNVIVTASGRVKILDFGLAKRQVLPGEDDSTWSRDPTRLSAEGALVGTLAYMAPEQALGQETDGRADIFSLGVVLYEMLSGRPPFAGRNAVQILDALLRQDPPPLEARLDDPRLPRLEAVLRRMLAKDPGERHPTMAEVAADLEAVRQGSGPASVVSAPGSRGVAVLSFANLTANGEDDWLGTGIAETVTADLRGVEGLTVISRERVHETLRRLGKAGDRGDDLVAVRVGREVGARWVLTGALQRSGDAVRVTARLVEVATGQIASTVKIDGRLSQIFELQDRIVRELSASLRLAPSAPERLADEETQVVEAYEAFSKGVMNLRLESYETLDRAVSLFERAIRLDPSYARAHLELGSSYAAKADYLAVPELHERALVSLRRALELRPGMVRAWREVGGALLALGRDDEAIDMIRRALELDPEDAGALGSMGRALFIGRAQFSEAADLFDRALSRNPQGGWWALQLAHCAALLRDFPRGEGAARRAVDLQEASLSGQEGVVIVGSHMRLGHLAALQGRHQEAIDSFERELAFLQRAEHALRGRISIELQMRLGAAYRRLGRAEEERAALEAAREAFEQRLRMGADDPFTRYYAACVYALRGQSDEAIACLEKAAERRRRFTVERARIEPELETLRGDARFRALVA